MISKQMIRMISILLCSLILAFPLLQEERVVDAAPAANTIYTFDLNSYFPDRDPNDAEVYEFNLFMSTLQGIVNKKGPKLYLYHKVSSVLENMTSREAQEGEQFWFNKFRSRGQWMSEYTVVSLSTLADVMNIFKSEITGIVLWDPKVDATVNVATTAAGVENAPIAMKGSALAATLTTTYALTVKQDLSGLFSGVNAKTDAYVWAKQQYIDTNKINPGLLGYVEDGYTRFPNTFHQNYTSARDYLVQNKAFVIDLSPWNDEKPNDAPSQTLGNDYNTLISILQALKDKWGNSRIISVVGFFPWWDKYSTHESKGIHDPVSGEWKLTEVFSKYNATLVSILDTFGQSNASFHTHAPVASKMTSPFRTPAAPALGNKTYVVNIIGDHDGSTVSRSFNTFWKDERRANTSLGWSLVPNFLEDTPDIAEYILSSASPRDVFTAGASGAGYSNPSFIASPAKWLEWNKYWYNSMGYTITGFMHNGNGGKLTSAMEQDYALFSNDGLIGLADSLNTPLPAVRNNHMAVVRLDLIQRADLTGASNILYNFTQALTNPGTSPNFLAVHSAFGGPAFHEELEKKAKAEHPEWNYEFVDPYTFSYLLHQKLEGSPTANSIMLKVDVPDMMIAGEDYPVEVTVRNMGQWWWTKGEYDRLGSPSPNQFVWKNFADGGYSNNVTDQRAFLSDSDWIASMGIKKFKFTVQAPAATGNFTFAAQMIRDLYGYQGQLYSKTVQVIARPGNGAQIVSISAPDTAAEGASIPVTITMKNIGTNTWTAANNFKLGTFPKFLLATDLSAVNDYVWTNFSNGGDNSGGAQNQRAYLGSSESIATGQTKQFSFNITVPNQRGTYSLAARMVQELVAWFGDTAVKDIRVGPSSAVSLDAALVEGAVPIHLAPDETTEVAVTVKNVGTSTWTRSSNIVLASTSSNQVVWSNFRDGGSSTSVTDQKALLSTTDSIGSEQSKTFSFKIQAPSAQGNYTVSARMKTDGGAEFGDTYTWTIKVVGSKNAELASSKIPTTMTAGSTQRVKIEVRNTGTLNWYNSDMVRLGTHPALNNQFQFGGFYPNGGYSNSITDQRVFINPNIQILRGKPYDFDFSITAPTATGTYKLSVQMIHDGVAAFGPAMEWNIQVVSGYQKTINAGAATNFTDTYGQVWLADQAYSTSNGWGYTGTSSAVSTPNTITVYDDSNPDTQENNMNIYQTARQGTSFEYKFDVSNGTYRVELSLAEFIKTADAQRKFSISAEGKRVVQDYDPYLLLGGANKGRDIALKEVTVSDGQLNLQFSSSIDQALINAIKVVRLR